MLLAAHSLAGGVLGEAVDNPPLAFLAGFVLHFLLDAIPHYDTTDDGKYTTRQIALVTIDSALGIMMLLIIFIKFSDHRLSFAMGTLGGVMPDFLAQIPVLRRWVDKSRMGKATSTFHERIQAISLPPALGLGIQVVIWAVAIYLMASCIV